MSRKQRKKRARQEARNETRRTERVRVPHAPKPYESPVPLEPVDGVRWRIPARGAMRVDGMVWADESLLPDLRTDASLEQVANVATLPGIVGASMAMPDIHWGYGFPIGGVAAFDMESGVVSPGGVGYDINCGVRLLAADVSLGDVRGRLPELRDALFDAVPAGVGSRKESQRLTAAQFDDVLAGGLKWAFHAGYADKDDRPRVEEGGCLEGADPALVSDRARKRGGPQLGTLGSGNHFAEVGVVEEVYDAEAAAAYGLREGGITLMIHSGSRGLGHQVCTDFLSEMLRAAVAHDIALVDRQLCCAPVRSRAGERYLGAMAAAANYAFVNRQLMTHAARRVMDELFGAQLKTVYDVCHNIAKEERHVAPGETEARPLMVHRKGATRALGPEHPSVPEVYRAIGQPVIIPGDMARYSFVLRGAARSSDTFGSACHGAGRLLSRGEAKRRFADTDVHEELRGAGVLVRGASRATVAEEMPDAYKNVADVVDVVDRGGLATKVARLRPLVCVKG
ncbi:MAG: RNA-splicing ligase RtcB [Sandaracinus sp.]|nr:RNA-splicing ligase RtcB [Sandaracinus sp.]MAR55926.1 RNA-splicing ligase RtcB [Rickettsiales bacterium]